MLAAERRNRILEKLQEEKRVVVSELSQEYKVSEETIRRIWKSWKRKGWRLKVTAAPQSMKIPVLICRLMCGKRKILPENSGLQN